MLVGRKVATLSITDARIQANLASQVVVQGSLGGLQVFSEFHLDFFTFISFVPYQFQMSLLVIFIMFIIFITKIDFVLSRFWIWQPRAKSINGSSASATILWWSRTRTSTFSSARVSTNPVKRRTKWRPSASTSSSRKRPIWLDYCSYYSLLLLFLIYSRKSSGRILSININRLSLLLITDYLILNDLRSIYSICCSYWCWQFDWIVAVICCCCYLEYRQKKNPPHDWISIFVLLHFSRK